MVTFWVCNMYIIKFHGGTLLGTNLSHLEKKENHHQNGLGDSIPPHQSQGVPTPTGPHCHKHAVEWLKSPPRSSPEVWLFSAWSTAVSLDARRDKGTSECAWTTAPRTARQSSGTSWFRNSAKEVFNASWMEGLSWAWWFQAPVESHYSSGKKNWHPKNESWKTSKAEPIFLKHTTKKKEKHNSGWPAVFSDFKPPAQLTGG